MHKATGNTLDVPGIALLDNHDKEGELYEAISFTTKQTTL